MKDVIVAKFGGSSLADSNQIKKVKNIVISDKRRRFVVPSAPGKRHSKDHKITDLLYLCHQHVQQDLPFDDVFTIIQNRYIEICRELNLKIDIKKYLDEIKEKVANGASADYTASRGEFLSGLILADYLNYKFIDAADLVVFKKNGQFDAEITKEKIAERLKNEENAVIPGFYGAFPDGSIKTFTRGGSDVSGAIIAGAVEAEMYENWTDVSGFLMADPRIVKNPKHIEKVTYKELRELAYMGASVLHEESVFPVKDAGIPINIRNTNDPSHKGTLIMNDLSPVESCGTITGIAGKKDFTVIAIDKASMDSETGFLRKVLTILEMNDIPVEHIPTGIDTVSLVIADNQLDDKLDKIIEEIKIQCQPDSVTYYPNMALIAVVGRGMIKTKGISSRIFGALAKEGINIRMISQGSSEMNIIVGIENDDFEKAIPAIYQAFENGD